MSGWALLLVGVSGAAASAVNTAAGGGVFLTYAVLLANGLSPLAANVTNTVGSVTGALGGAYGYRRELRGQGGRLLRLLPSCALGSLAGVALLLVLPAAVFAAVAPALVLLACLLVGLQPWLRRQLAGGAATRWLPLQAGVFLCGMYGGYFGAGNSVLVLAVLGTLLREVLQRVNALKGTLVGVANATAAVPLALLAPVSWPAAGALAVGYVSGGLLGARLARRLSEPVLRAVVVVVGVVVAAVLQFRR